MRLTEEKFSTLPIGTTLMVSLVGEQLECTTLDKPFYNCDCDEPEWEVETDMGVVSIDNDIDIVTLSQRRKAELFDKLTSWISEHDKEFIDAAISACGMTAKECYMAFESEEYAYENAKEEVNTEGSKTYNVTLSSTYSVKADDIDMAILNAKEMARISDFDAGYSDVQELEEEEMEK